MTPEERLEAIRLVIVDKDLVNGVGVTHKIQKAYLSSLLLQIERIMFEEA